MAEPVKEVIVKPKKKINKDVSIQENVLNPKTTGLSFDDAIRTLTALGFEISHPRLGRSYDEMNMNVKKPNFSKNDDDMEEQKVVRKKTAIQRKIPKKKEEDEEEYYEEEAVKPVPQVEIKKDQIQQLQNQPTNTKIVPQVSQGHSLGQQLIQAPVSKPVVMGLGQNPLGYKRNPFGI